jgi:hypothetical protein
MLKSFFDRDEECNSAEQEIVGLRDSEDHADSTVTDILAKIAEDEVDFSYSLWLGDFKTVVTHGNAVTDKLTDSRLSAYRALGFDLVTTRPRIAWLCLFRYSSLSFHYLPLSQQGEKGVFAGE